MSLPVITPEYIEWLRDLANKANTLGDGWHVSAREYMSTVSNPRVIINLLKEYDRLAEEVETLENREDYEHYSKDEI